MRALFEPLKKTGLLKRGRLQTDIFARMPLPRILDVFDEVTAITSTVPTDSQLAGKLHCASIGLSGGMGECTAERCRLRRADEVARFGALYSDHVLVHNSLADLSPSFGHEPGSDSDKVRQRLLTDLMVLNHLRPLIEKDILIPYSTPRTYCSSCFATRQLGDEAGTRFKRARRVLQKEVLEGLEIKLQGSGHNARISVSGRGAWFDHGSSHFKVDPATVPSLVERPNLLEKLLADKGFTASSTLTKALGYHASIVERTLGNVAYQMAITDLTGADVLSHRRVDLDVLQGIAADDRKARTNAVLAQNWNNVVPFAGDVSIARLVQLRARERDAFVRFRTTLQNAVEEALGSAETLSAKDAKTLFADTIQPELSRLNQSVRKAKRDLVTQPLASAAAITAVIGLGATTGMLPTELMVLGKALGLGKVTYDAVRSAIALGDTRKSIRTEPYYYLWKVQRSTSNSQHQN